MGKIYNYIIRNAEDSEKLLIAFTDLPENRAFITRLVQAFSVINLRITNYDDLWMQDEIALGVSSDVGEFIIYRDAEGYYFISADSAAQIMQLDDILSQSSGFMKLTSH